MSTFISAAATNVAIKHKDKEYFLHPLTFKDAAAYVFWYQFRELRVAEEQTKHFSPEMRDRILNQTYEKCLNKKWEYIDDVTGDKKQVALSWEAPEVQETCNQPDGISYQLYLTLKHNHPDITEELVNEIVTLDIYKQILGKILIVQGLNNEEPEKGEVKSLNQ